jgi:hypothetical protein
MEVICDYFVFFLKKQIILFLATCERFGIDTSGHCGSDTACVTQCSDVPQQTAQPIAACASPECVDTAACMPLSSASLWSKPAQICRVGMMCGDKKVCDASGACVSQDGAIACTEADKATTCGADIDCIAIGNKQVCRRSHS